MLTSFDRRGNRSRVAERVFASLPWYDLPELRPATDTLWRELAHQFEREGLTNVPSRLARDVHYEKQWASHNFLFGQACGYDVRIAHVRSLQVVATPRYDAPGCVGARHSSFVVVREGAPWTRLADLRGGRCAINTTRSHSGMNALRALVAPLHSDGRFFSRVRISGSHETSLRMVQRGEVDVAAVDAVTHALLARYRPSALAGTRILHRTQAVPAPPFVTSASTSRATLARMREAVRRTLDLPSVVPAKQRLLLSGVDVLSDSAYVPIERLESIASRHSYEEIPGAARSR